MSIASEVTKSKLTICGKILSLTVFGDRWSIIRGRLSRRQTRRARSGLLKSRTMTGVICESYSSSESFLLMRITSAKTFGPPPPNSADLSSSGSTLTLKNSSGKSSDSATASSSLMFVRPWWVHEYCEKLTYCKKSPLSVSDFKPRFSMPSVRCIRGESKNEPDFLPCSRK